MDIEVSVIIPAYNSAEYIAQAIDSVLNQTYSNLEIIIIDDASTDNTLDVITSFVDRRISVISNKNNLGVSATRNIGIAKAQGNWIALLDSDDWYATERLEKLLKAAWQTNADLIADNLYLIRERENYPWSTLLAENREDWQSIQLVDAMKFIKTDRPASINSPRNWSFGYVKPLIKYSFLKEKNLKYDEKIRIGEDFILYFRCTLYRARFFLISQPYYYYRLRQSSLSVTKATEYLNRSYQITESLIKTEEAIQKNALLLSAMQKNLSVFQKQSVYHDVVELGKQGKIVGAIIKASESPQVFYDIFSKAIAIIYRKFRNFLNLTKR